MVIHSIDTNGTPLVQFAMEYDRPTRSNFPKDETLDNSILLDMYTNMSFIMLNKEVRLQSCLIVVGPCSVDR